MPDEAQNDKVRWLRPPPVTAWYQLPSASVTWMAAAVLLAAAAVVMGIAVLDQRDARRHDRQMEIIRSCPLLDPADPDLTKLAL